MYVGLKYGKPLEHVRPLIIGQIGTSVRFRISREGREFDCDIVRQPTGYTPLPAAPSPKSSVAPQQLLDVNVKITTAEVEEAVPSTSPAPAEVRHSKGIYSVKLQHEAKMPHELTLFPGDIVEVVRKHKTGWWEGVAARSGEKGWFPSHVLCTNLGNAQLNVSDKRGGKDGNISILQDEIEHLKHTVVEQVLSLVQLVENPFSFLHAPRLTVSGRNLLCKGCRSGAGNSHNCLKMQALFLERCKTQSEV